MEFDSSAAKLVNLDVILAQLVSPSMALPAQLVSLYLSISESKYLKLDALNLFTAHSCKVLLCLGLRINKIRLIINAKLSQLQL